MGLLLPLLGLVGCCEGPGCLREVFKSANVLVYPSGEVRTQSAYVVQGRYEAIDLGWGCSKRRPPEFPRVFVHFPEGLSSELSALTPAAFDLLLGAHGARCDAWCDIAELQGQACQYLDFTFYFHGARFVGVSRTGVTNEAEDARVRWSSSPSAVGDAFPMREKKVIETFGEPENRGSNGMF